MPRSGTSLVTHLLHRCGFNVGPHEQLMPPAIDNPDGFWENMRFVRLNERLLAESGGTWYAPPAGIRATPETATEARSVIAQFGGCEPWLWKDPRNALTLSFWRSLLPDLKVVVCIRHPHEAAASIVASNFIPWPWEFYWGVSRPDSPIRLRDHPTRILDRALGAAHATVSTTRRRSLIAEVALDLWRIYNARILEETTPAERVVTHYEMLLENPRSELQRILSFAGVEASEDAIENAIQIVRPRMRHQRASAAVLPDDISRLYRQLAHEAGYEP